jgi:hypothetical protein
VYCSQCFHQCNNCKKFFIQKHHGIFCSQCNEIEKKRNDNQQKLSERLHWDFYCSIPFNNTDYKNKKFRDILDDKNYCNYLFNKFSDILRRNVKDRRELSLKKLLECIEWKRKIEKLESTLKKLAKN